MTKFSTWHPIEIPRRVKEARSRYHLRHLPDLLAAVGISYWTARKWAQKPDRFGEWLKACAGVAIPYRHELDMLRYMNKPTVAAIQKRMVESVSEGLSDPDALHAAVDEIMGAERANG